MVYLAILPQSQHKNKTMCQILSSFNVPNCSSLPKFDPCAKSVQYLDQLNTLIFPEIFSTGDILTLVDHTLIDHTACMTIFPLRGCVISLRFRWDQRRSSGVHLCHKDPKSVKKWLSYNYFHTERLRDFIENHMRSKGILGCSFVPQRSEIGQEMAELWLFSR